MSAGRNINSQSRDWGTPPKYVSAVKEFFGGSIALDPCSNVFSVVNAEIEYRLPEKDGLKESWDFPMIFVNPPYGRDKERGTSIKDWLKRCYEANAKHNSEVLALVPVATNTKHWKEHIFGSASAICFLADTRLKFLVDGKEGGKGAPMACCMVYWGVRKIRFDDVFGRFGKVVDMVGDF